MSQTPPPQAGRSDSVRRAGIKNVLISVVVAAASYFSLTLIARTFGGSVGSDAYFYLASLTTLASGLIGSLLATVFLPAFIELQIRAGREEANRFASSVFSGCLVLCAIAAAIAAIWHTRFFLQVSRFDAAHLADMRPVLLYFAPVFLIGVMAEFFRVLALASGKFSTAAVTALFAPVLLILFIAAFADSLHEESLAASLLCAKVMTLVLLVFVVVQQTDVRIRLMWWPDTHTFRFVRSSVPYWSANVVTNVATFYFDYMASGLGAGVLTSLAYAQRIVSLPTAVFLNPLMEIARTRLALAQANRDDVGFNRQYNALLGLALYFSIPIAGLYMVLDREIVSGMFQRGAFGPANVDISAACLFIYAWTIPLSALFMVNGRACESYQRLTWPAVFGTVGNLAMMVATSVLVSHMGVLGIPFAKLASDALYFLPFGFIALTLFGGRPDLRQLLRTLAAAAAATAVPALAFALSPWTGGHEESATSIRKLLLLVAGFLAAYALLLGALDGRVRREIHHFWQSKRSRAA
jgi:putative peptidoglycan lipid II flippase